MLWLDLLLPMMAPLALCWLIPLTCPLMSGWWIALLLTGVLARDINTRSSGLAARAARITRGSRVVTFVIPRRWWMSTDVVLVLWLLMRARGLLTLRMRLMRCLRLVIP